MLPRYLTASRSQRISIFPHTCSPPPSTCSPGRWLQPQRHLVASALLPLLTTPPATFAHPQVCKLTPSDHPSNPSPPRPGLQQPPHPPCHSQHCCKFLSHTSEHLKPCWKPPSVAPWGPDTMTSPIPHSHSPWPSCTPTHWEFSEHVWLCYTCLQEQAPPSLPLLH